MKKIGVVCFVVLFALLTFSARKTLSENRAQKEPELLSIRAESRPNEEAVSADSVGTTEIPSSASTTADQNSSDDPSSFARFDQWLETFDPEKATPRQIATGHELAQARRPKMTQLMRDDPRAALARAVSLHQWASLPESIQEQVETPFSIVADYDAYFDCRPREKDHDHKMMRFVRGKGTAHVFGQFGDVLSKEALPMQGIQLGDEIVLRNEALQVLDEKDAKVARAKFPAGNPADESFVTGEKIPGSVITALWGGKVFTFANTAEVNELEEAVNKAKAEPGPKTAKGIIDAYIAAAVKGSTKTASALRQQPGGPEWSTTPKTVLVVRMDYTPPLGNPYTLTMLTNLYSAVSNNFLEQSYGDTYLIPTIATQVVYYPNPVTSYIANGDYVKVPGGNRVTVDGEALVAAAGYALTNYDIVALIGPDPGIGGAYAGGPYAWFNGIHGSNVFVHEHGHNYGLGHASYIQDFTSTWLPVRRNPNGTVIDRYEYEDPYDMMGGNGRFHPPFPIGHFHARAKDYLNWLPSGQVVDATTNGVYRIYNFDHFGARALNKPMALRLRAGGIEIYGGYRQQFDNAPNNTPGLCLVTGEGSVIDFSTKGNRQYLIDTVPLPVVTNSVVLEDHEDSPLGIGKWWDDPTGNYRLRVASMGGTPPSAYIDVQVERTENHSVQLFTDATQRTNGLLGTYCYYYPPEPTNSTDWRGLDIVVGRRVDPAINFEVNADWGIPSSVGLNNDFDWHWFLVQWDGVMVVNRTVNISKRNIYMGRMWIDLNRDGSFASAGPELINDGWGIFNYSIVESAPMTLNPGTYPVRIQFLQGGASRTTCQLVTVTEPFSLYADAALTTNGLVGSYVNSNLRGVSAQSDWRTSQTIAGTRIDAYPAFTSGDWGNRAALNLTGGSTNNWDIFSVQWDGWINVTAPMQFACRSDDSSRFWIDLNKDGSFGNTGPELVTNHWGTGIAGNTWSGKSPVVSPGTYRIRIQYEEGSGGNTFVFGGEPVYKSFDCGSTQPLLVETAASDGPRSLTEAINTLNSCSGGSGTIQINVPGTIRPPASGFPSIQGNVTIIGPGRTQLKLSGVDAVGAVNTNMFIVNHSASLTLSNLSLVNVSADVMKNNGTINMTGCGVAAIHVTGTVNLTNCVFAQNSLTGDTFEVASNATLRVNSCTFSNVVGGVIYNQGTTILNGALFTNCVSGPQRVGGVIYNLGTLKATNCVFASNTSAGGNGGVSGRTNVWNGNTYPLDYFALSGGGGGGGGGLGGALFSERGDVVLVGCSFLNNVARGGNGGNGTSIENERYLGRGGSGGLPLGGVGGPSNGQSGSPGSGIGGGGGGGASDTFNPGVGGAGAFGGGGGGGGWATQIWAAGGGGGSFAGAGRRAHYPTGGGGGGGAGLGGAVCVLTGTVNVVSCNFNGNTAIGGVGGQSADGVAESGQGVGGAIMNLGGELTLTANTFNGNSASSQGNTIYDGRAVTQTTGIFNGLLAYWDFDAPGSNTNVTEATFTFTGPLRNSSSNAWVTGFLSNAVDFDGLNDYAFVPTSPKTYDGKLSISAWVWADSRPTWASIAKNWAAANAGQFHFGLEETNGRLNIYIQEQDGTQVSVSDSVALPTNSWQHVAFVADGAMLRLYRNGVQVGATNYDGTIRTNSPITALGIGVKLNDANTAPASAAPGHWDGKLDEMAIWDRSLGTTEVMNLYQAGTVKLPISGSTNPVAMTSSNNIISSSSADVFGAVNPGGLSSLAWFQWESASPYAIFTTPPIAVTGTNNLNISATLSGLVPGNSYSYRVVISNAFGVAIGANLPLAFSTPEVVTLPSVQTGVTSAEWHGTVNPGLLDATAWFEWIWAGPSGQLSTNSAPVTILAGSGTFSMDLAVTNLIPGRIHSARIVASNVVGVAIGGYSFMQLFSGRPDPVLTNQLMAYWSFDDAKGTTVRDGSSFSNDATLFNADTNAAWTNGVFGGALWLDGTNDYVMLTNSPKADNELTFSGWVLANSHVEWGTILKNWGSSIGGQFHFGFWEGSGQLSVYVTQSDGTVTLTREPAAFPLGSWQHVVFVFNRDFVKLYRNGTLVSGDYATGYQQLIQNGAPSLGMGVKPGDTPGSISDIPGYWAGKFDDFVLWSRAFTDQEVKQLYVAASFGYSVGAQLAPPAISIKRGGGNLTVNWPGDYTFYRLQQSPTLDGTNWIEVPGLTTNSFILSETNTAMFYRLRTP